MLRKRDLSVISKEEGSKERELIEGERNYTELIDVDIARRNEFTLSNNQLRKLGELITRVEKYYGVPQDIEWAWVKGEFYLLQARPITTLGRKSQVSLVQGKLTKFQRFMIDDLIEHYPEAPTMLDYAVVTISYQALINRGLSFGWKGPKATEIISLEPDGRIKLIPPKIKLSFKPISTIRNLLKQNKSHSDYSLEWAKIREEVQKKVAYFESIQLENVPDKELIQYFKEIFELAERVSERRFFYVMDMNVLPMLGLSFMLKLFGGKHGCSMVDLITSGLNYRTAVIDRDLNRLALMAEQSSMTKLLILERNPEAWKDIFKNLSEFSEGREFLEQLKLFLVEYGYRTEKTYQPFISESWKENPRNLLVAIRAALQDTRLWNRGNKEIERNKEHQKWVQDFQVQLRGIWKKLFQWSYHLCRENHILREETLFELERLFVAGRLMSRELGERLSKAEFILKPDEIVYFTREEIPEILLNPVEDKLKIRQLIKERQRNFALNQTLWKNTLMQTARKNKGDCLIGQAGSPGMAEGAARIINSVNEFGNLKKGEILVCPYTDPSWTPLFALAVAVVADTGGPLSHAAIVAREYGIPAVLGTKIGTHTIKEGDQIIVDGTEGKVIRKK